MASRAGILVAEDDSTIRALLGMALQEAGYTEVTMCGRGDDALDLIRRDRPDLVLLDVMLPGLDGLSVARRVRADPSLADVRIVMVTARTEPDDVCAGLEAGADDYVTKPFDRRVLLARVASVLRRGQPAPGADFDGLSLDPAGRVATLRGRRLDLTPGEFDLLSRLVAHRGRVFARPPAERTVDVQVAKLRQKLGDWARHVETVRGIGYRVG